MLRHRVEQKVEYHWPGQTTTMIYFWYVAVSDQREVVQNTGITEMERKLENHASGADCMAHDCLYAEHF